MIHAKKKTQRGFTLIELMLSMAFISLLLLAIAMTTMQLARTYERGTTLRSLNQAARDFGDMLRRDFAQANAKRVFAGSDNGNSVIQLVDTNGPVSGRLCLGQVSYLWNYAATLDREGSNNNQAAVVRDGRLVNMVRAIDEGGDLCRQNSEGRYIRDLSAYDTNNITNVLEPIETRDGTALAIHNLSLRALTRANEESGLFRITYLLGTSRQAEIDIDNGTCRAPNDAQSNAEYCAINNFEVVVRANG